MKRPAFQFYPGDWQRDTALRLCSVGARGLWIEMICIMHQAEPYGHLVVNGHPIEPQKLARMVGAKLGDVIKWTGELADAGVFDRDGETIVSRRMVRDESLRKSRGDGGHLGGNPKLTSGYNKPGYLYLVKRHSDGAHKIGIAINPTNRLYKLRSAHQGDTLDLINSWFVDDMGVSEAELHAQFAGKKVQGEWFSLSSDDLYTLQSTLKGKDIGRETPSSSTSSSSSVSKPKTKGAAQAPFVLPDWIPQDHWQAWIEARTKARKAPTDYAKRLAVLKLENLREQGHAPAQVLMASAFNGWSGLFPPKEVK